MAMSAIPVRNEPVPVLAASTTDQRESDRFDSFRDALCDVYLGIRPERTSSGAFDADLLAYEWDGVILSRMRAPGHEARRDAASLARVPDDALFVNVSPNSSARLRHLDETWRMPAGAPILIDNSAPFTLHLDPRRRFRLYSLRVPRAFAGIEPTGRDIAELNRRLVASGAGARLGAQCDLLTAEFDAGRWEAASAMTRAVIAMLRGVLTGADSETDAPSRLESGKRAASTRIHDPDFDVHEFARSVNVSVRTIQNDFRAAGETFRDWLLDARLEAARERLRSPAWRGRSIEALAEASGFRDIAHFHHAFRDRFDTTPGSLRPLSPTAQVAGVRRRARPGSTT